MDSVCVIILVLFGVNCLEGDACQGSWVGFSEVFVVGDGCFFCGRVSRVLLLQRKLCRRRSYRPFLIVENIV